MLALALWPTHDPSETAPEAPAIAPSPQPDVAAPGPALHGTGPSPVAPADLADRFTLRGLVVDEEDQPLAGVLVRCLRAPAPARDRDPVWRSFELALRGHAVRTPVGAEVRTGDDGRFEVPGLLVAEQYDCRLLPDAPRAERSSYVRARRAGIHEMRFVLRSGPAIRGRVVDAAGRGVQAFVFARGDVGAALLHGLPRRETDPAGRFEIAALPDGRWSFTVAVAGRGHRTGIAVRTPTSGEVVLPFRLADGAVIAGRVTEAEGRLLPGARILAKLRGLGAGQELYVAAHATTDAAGRYRLEGLDPGRLDGIAVEAEGYAPVTGLYSGFPVRSGAVLEADVVLARGTVVEGRVLDAEGRAVPGAFVRLSIELPSRGAFPSSTRRRTTADAQGRYRFERLLPVGTGRLDAGTQDAWTPPASGGSADRGFDLAREGPVIERDLVLAAVPRVRGLVVDADGRPVAGAWVSAEGSGSRGPAGTGRAPPRALSGEDGGFALAGMAPGETRTLQARTGTLRSEPLPALGVPSAPEPAPAVRLVLRPTAGLRGRVVRPDGSGWAGTRVVLNPEDSARRGSLTANTDAEGRFVFDGLRAGRYQLPAQRWDGEEGSAPQRFDLAWGQVVEGVTVVREPAQTITGLVVGSQDEPVPRAVVEFQRQDSTDHRPGGVR